MIGFQLPPCWRFNTLLKGSLLVAMQAAQSITHSLSPLSEAFWASPELWTGNRPVPSILIYSSTLKIYGYVTLWLDSRGSHYSHRLRLLTEDCKHKLSYADRENLVQLILVLMSDLIRQEFNERRKNHWQEIRHGKFWSDLLKPEKRGRRISLQTVSS